MAPSHKRKSGLLIFTRLATRPPTRANHRNGRGGRIEHFLQTNELRPQSGGRLATNRKHGFIAPSQRRCNERRMSAILRGGVFLENDVNAIPIDADRTDARAARPVVAVGQPELRVAEHAKWPGGAGPSRTHRWK